MQRCKILAEIPVDQILKKVEETELKRKNLISEIKSSLLEKKAFSIENLNAQITEGEKKLSGIDPQYPYLVSMRAFIEGISIYFQPELYPYLFEEKKPRQRDFDFIFPLVLPEKLMNVESKRNNFTTSTPKIKKIYEFFDIGRSG